MPLIQIPQAVAFDTAILAVWAHRWTRGDVSAHHLVDSLLRSNARPLLTVHHLVELLGHASDDVVASRARFIGNLGQLFWIKARNSDGIGGILDLHALEIRARLEDSGATYPELLSRVRPEALAFGGSRDISDLMQEAAFVAAARERIRRRRIVASMSRTQVSAPEITHKEVDARTVQSSLRTVLANFEREQEHLESQLRTVGDPRLAEPARVARQFFDELRDHVSAAAAGGNVNLADVLGRLGIQEVDLNRPLSADILGDKYVWKTRSQVLARIASVPVAAVEALCFTDMPSTHLCEDIAVVRGGGPRAGGGDVDDASLACLSFYARLTTVDKRTAEAVRQVRSRKPELDGIMGSVVKVPTLEALETSVAAFG